MKTGLDLVSLAQQITDNAAAKKDFIVPARQLEVAVGTSEGRPSIDLVVPDQGQFPIRPIAHDQIGAYADIPSKYYDRMLADSPELLVNNVNHWLRKAPVADKRMVRTLRGFNRSLLSNRYQRIEHEEIAGVSLPILLNTPGVKPVSTEITERRLYIQATTDRVVGEVKKGDVVQAGLIISNSETGHGSVSVKAMFYRLVCLNGMILPTAFRANHIGRRIDDNEELYKDDTRAADDKAVLLKVRDTVQAYLSHDFFNKKLSEMQALTEGEITGKVDKAVEVLSNKIGATELEQEGILQSLIKGGDLSRWGILNAVTHQAHTVKDYDRSVEFESFGGKLLELPKSDWREILEAA
jgi:hypothetical protein